MCQDDVAELPSWTEGARRMHEVGSEMDADSQVCPSKGVRGKSGNPNLPNVQLQVQGWSGKCTTLGES